MHIPKFHIIDQRKEVFASCRRYTPLVELSEKTELILHRFGPRIVDDYDKRLIAHPQTAVDVAHLFSRHGGLPRPNLSAVTGGRMAYGAVLNPRTGALYLALPWTAIGAHAAGHNRSSIGLAMLHDGRYDKLTPFGMHCLLESIKHIRAEFWWLTGRNLALKSHDEVRDEPKSCPGGMLDMDALRAVVG